MIDCSVIVEMKLAGFIFAVLLLSHQSGCSETSGTSSEVKNEEQTSTTDDLTGDLNEKLFLDILTTIVFWDLYRQRCDHHSTLPLHRPLPASKRAGNRPVSRSRSSCLHDSNLRRDNLYDHYGANDYHGILRTPHNDYHGILRATLND